MAVLSNADRQAESDRYQRDASADRTPIPVTKAQMKAVVDAIDDWVDANVTSFNNAIPQPQRGLLTAKEKARLLVYVVRRRYEVA
jgi:hypothetical protein